MRSLRGAMVAIGAAVGAAALAGFATAACGSSNSTPGGSDSGSDSTADVEPEVGTDTGIDQSVADSGPGTDTGIATDSGTGTDSGIAADTSIPPGDSGGDAAHDAAEAGIDPILWAEQFAQVYCNTFLGCCRSALGGTYDTNSCIIAVSSEGWELSLPDTNIYARGNTVLNTTKATACLAAMTSFPCGTQTAAQWQTITSACELVVTGTIPIGTAGCLASIECVPGAYCDPTNDGGTCTALATQGQACDTKINSTLPVIPDQMCDYLGSGTGSPPLFCDLIDNGPDAATCQPQLAANANCCNGTTGYYDDMACAPPSLCGDDCQCGGTTSYPYQPFCQLYKIADAGGD